MLPAPDAKEPAAHREHAVNEPVAPVTLPEGQASQSSPAALLKRPLLHGRQPELPDTRGDSVPAPHTAQEPCPADAE